MAPHPFAKPHASAGERIDHLRAKGLIVPRPKVAARKIEQIGYERLRIYFLSRRNPDLPGKPFAPGTTYAHILSLYACDEKLREICFAGVGTFELLFRNRLSEVLSARFGSHPYFERPAFADALRHTRALEGIFRTFSQSKDERAKHYQRTYTHPPLPPIWTFKEFLTFGAAARLYENLAPSIRSEIAGGFGVASLEVFDSWLPCFVDLRNICAHHDRLFNRRFQKQPKRLRRVGVPAATPETLKGQLECIDFALAAGGSPRHLVGRVQRVIARHPAMQPAEAGY